MTALPYLLGYRPSRSLVVVATAAQADEAGRASGPERLRGRLVMTVRADLTGPGDVRSAVAVLTAPVRRLRARYGADLVLHCYLWDADEALGVSAGKALRRFADVTAVVLNDVVLVGRDLYLPLLEAGNVVDTRVAREGERVGTSPGWRRLPSAADVPLIADLVLRGRGVAPGRDDAVAVVRRRDEVAARATDEAITDLRRQESPGFDGLAALGVLGRWVCGLVDAPPTAHERARIAVVLQDRMARDVVLARWLPRLFTLQDLLEPEAVADLCQLVPPWPLDDGGALGRLITLAGQVPVDLTVPLITLAGLMAWGTGEGTLANEAVDVALEADPDYRMAQLLRQALDRAMPPEVPPSQGKGDGTGQAEGAGPGQRDEPHQGPDQGPTGRGRGRAA